MSRAYYRAKPKICPAWAAEAGEGGGGKGGSISRRMDNRRGKEFFTPLFLTPGAFRRRWAGKRGERSPTRLTTCRTRMSYFDIGTSYPIRSAWRLFRKRGRTIPWQYSPTSGFVRSPSTTPSPSLLVALFILRAPLQSPLCSLAGHRWSAFKGWFLLLPTSIADVINGANRINRVCLIARARTYDVNYSPV